MLIDSFPITTVGIYRTFDTPSFPEYKVNLQNISSNFQSKDGVYILVIIIYFTFILIFVGEFALIYYLLMVLFSLRLFAKWRFQSFIDF